MNWLSPFQYPFMWEAFAVGVLVGAVCAVLSCFLVLKGWSLMGDAVSHAVLPGIVLAYLIGLPLAVGAFASGLLCAVGTGFIKNHSRVKEDTVMGVMFTGLFALGLILVSKVESDIHLMHVLFGSLLGIPREQIIQTVAIGGSTLLVTLALRKDLLLFCFDPRHARTIGLNTQFLNYLLLTLLSLTIVASLQAVGVILVVAMLVTPGCIGFLLTDRFPKMLVIATTAAVFSTVAGIYFSFFFRGTPSSSCIVLVQVLIFLAALLWAPKRGLLAQRRLARAAVQPVPKVPTPAAASRPGEMA